VQLCKPVNTMPGALRLVGHLGGAGTEAGDLATALTAANGSPHALPGEVNPTPFPAPSPPPALPKWWTESGSSVHFSFDADELFGEGFAIGGAGLAIGMLLAPEVTLPAMAIAAGDSLESGFGLLAAA
jgi:hypothetical protein